MVNLKWTVLLGFIVIVSCYAPSDAINTEEFILEPGFEIELVASEPLIDSPVAVTMDEAGSIWVVELPGYMRDIEGSEEEKADGKIVRLTDADGDGVMDRREVIKDGLVAPRAISLIYGGLLYTESTNLWWEPLGTNSGEKVLVDSLYVIGGNIEHQPNGLLYNIDNWIYSAKSNARYRMIDGRWVKEATSFRGQWGITHDEWGRLFYNDNSNPLIGDYIIPNTLIGNPYQKIRHNLNQQIAHDRSLKAYQATAVNRGYLPGVLDSTGKVREFTSACGPLIYGGGTFGTDYHGDAFVCGPEANLIKRYDMMDSMGVVLAQPVAGDHEFLVSRDETFRPVNLMTGTDGAIYVTDLRKGVIQHRAYMTSYLRDKILQNGMDTIIGLGRIYRIQKSGQKASEEVFKRNVTLRNYIAWLDDPSMARRMFAQKQMVSSGERSLASDLETVALNSMHPYGQAHALRTLDGLGVLDQAFLLNLSQSGTLDPVVWYHILALADAMTLEELLSKAPLGISATLDLLIAHLSGKVSDRTLWSDLAKSYNTDKRISEVLVSGIDTAYLQSYLDIVDEDPSTHIYQAVKLTIDNFKSRKWQAPQLMTAPFKDERTAGLDLYAMYCSSCHGLDGAGRNNLAPPIMQSEYVNGPVEKIILVLLNGLKGPIHVNGETYNMNLVMPGLRDNPALSDNDIANIVLFLRNSFSYADPFINVDELTGKVAGLRKQSENRSDLFTEEDLEQWMIKIQAIPN